MEKRQILNVLRAKEASQYLGIGESTFWRWVHENRLPKGKKIVMHPINQATFKRVFWNLFCAF